MLKISDFKTFPTTRYQGSKRKIVNWIYKNIRDLEFETVLDTCGGPGTVSYLFKKMNKTVTYNDKLAFNYQIGKAIIENNEIILNETDIHNLLAANTEGDLGFIQKTFQGYYYNDNENQWLDNLVCSIYQMNTYNNEVLEYKKAIAYYALFQACLTKRPFNMFHRKNLYIRTNDVERNFGNKITWERNFAEQFKIFTKEANNAIFNSGKRCIATNLSVFEMEKTDYDLVYIDPPYISKNGKNETADYLKCYHFLEGMTNYDGWEERIDYETKNLRFKDLSEQNNFKMSTIYSSLETIMEKFQNSILVLSYKKGGVPSIEELKKLIGKYKKLVYTRSMHYKYALNKQNGDAKKNREVLIIGL
jgi:adenine-specific DNA-methyltransferase